MLSLKVWHSRFNHCGEKKLLKTLGDKVSKKQIEDFSKETCIGCMQGKTHRNPIITKNKIKKDYEALELLVADTVGPYDRSIDRKRGALVVGCAGSNFLWFLPYFSKSEVAGLFIALLRRLELAYPGKVKRVRTDNGTEFINKTLRGFLQTTGVEHERTIPYEHEMNGRAENNNRILLEGIRSVLQQSKLSRYWWSYAGKAVAYICNLQKPSAGGLSPWKYVRNSVEPLERLRVFGFIGFAHIGRDIRRKLDATAVKARFLGYSEDSVGYIVQRLDTKRIFYSRSFYCNEDLFVTVPVSDRLLAATGEYITVDNMQSLLQRDAEEEEDIDTFLQPTEEEDPNLPYDNVDETAEAIPTTVPTQPEIVIEEPVQEGTVEDLTEEIVAGPVEDTTDVGVDIQGLEAEPNFTDISTENIIQGGRTRSQAQVVTTKSEENEQQKALVLRKIRRAVLKFKLAYNVKTKRAMNAKGFRSYKEAVKQDSSWEDAYIKEIKKLESLGNMEVIDRTPEMKCIPFVEVLTEKTDNISGEVTLKVRLAARGDLQTDRPENVYSPAAGTTEMRVFISLMKVLEAHVLQGDCPAAYLNGRLEEDVYLYLPEGHPEKNKENSRVYRCPSSIYGLAVAGRVWYYTFVREVAKFDFKPLPRVPTLFILRRGNKVIYLQLYVDDFLLGSVHKDLLAECDELLKKKFQVKCTSDISKFVGMQIERKNGKVYVHQEDMIADLGLKYRVEKGFETPLIPGLKWNEDSVALTDKRLLQTVFGELNYVAGLSRPDIAFATNKIARMLQSPTKEVYRCAKRVVSYLASTSSLGLEYKNWNRDEWKLEVYCDASFADIKEDKFKSTGGYLVWLNENLVSWKSKKLRYVCASTSESEYLACYSAAKEALFIGYLVEEAFQKSVWPIIINCDNKAVVDILNSAGPSDMTKYMSTRYFKLQEWSEQGLIHVQRVSSKDNVAANMTKTTKDFGLFQQRVLKTRGSVKTSTEDTLVRLKWRTS